MSLPWRLGPPTPAGSTRAPVERVSPSDRAFLAMDTGDVPEQFGVVLELDGDLSLRAVRDLVAERVEGIPRLRQRLVSVPLGCGGPIWIDDRGFDIAHHVGELECNAQGDEQGLMETVLSLVSTPLPRDRPLWSVVLLHLPPGERCALLVLLHHVVADGVGGLTVLAQLVDPGGDAAGVDFPRPRPHTAVLLADALVTKARAVTRVPRSWRSLRSSMAAGGGFRPGPVAPCSLMRQTGPRRRMAVVRTGYDALRAAAHRQGATTNDALLVAVAGALGQVLETRGEHLDSVIVTVPVSGRRTDHQRLLGNLVSPMLVPVPTTGARSQRLADVAETVRARRSAATGPAPIAVLGWLFRPMAALGGYRWYMNHQRRFHTLVSHLRGPGEPVSFGGRRIVSAVPVGVAECGNSTVYFEALSYDGTLTVAAIVDPDHFPDLDVLSAALEKELGETSSL